MAKLNKKTATPAAKSATCPQTSLGLDVGNDGQPTNRKPKAMKHDNHMRYRNGLHAPMPCLTDGKGRQGRQGNHAYLIDRLLSPVECGAAKENTDAHWQVLPPIDDVLLADKAFDLVSLYGKENLFFTFTHNKAPIFNAYQEPQNKVDVTEVLRRGWKEETHRQTKGILKPAIIPCGIRNWRGAMPICLEVDDPNRNPNIQRILDSLYEMALTAAFCWLAAPSNAAGHFHIWTFIAAHNITDKLFAKHAWKTPIMHGFPYTEESTDKQGRKWLTTTYGNEIKGNLANDNVTLHSKAYTARLFDFFALNINTEGITHSAFPKLLVALPYRRRKESPTTKPQSQRKQSSQSNHDGLGPRITKRNAEKELDNICAEISASGKYLTVEQLAPKAFTFHALTNGKEGIKRKLEDACSDFKPDTRARAIKQIAFYEQTHNEQSTYRIFETREDLRTDSNKEKEETARTLMEEWKDNIQNRRRIVMVGKNDYYDLLPATDNPQNTIQIPTSKDNFKTLLTAQKLAPWQIEELLSLLLENRCKDTITIHYGPGNRIITQEDGAAFFNLSDVQLRPLPTNRQELAKKYPNSLRYYFLVSKFGKDGANHYLRTCAYAYQAWLAKRHLTHGIAHRANLIVGPTGPGKNFTASVLLGNKKTSHGVFNAPAKNVGLSLFGKTQKQGGKLSSPLLAAHDIEHYLDIYSSSLTDKLRDIVANTEEVEVDVKYGKQDTHDLNYLLYISANLESPNSPVPDLSDSSIADKINIYYFQSTKGTTEDLNLNDNKIRQRMIDECVLEEAYLAEMKLENVRYGTSEPYGSTKAKAQILAQRGAEDAEVFFANLLTILRHVTPNLAHLDLSLPLTFHNVLDALDRADEHKSKPILKRISGKRGPSSKIFKRLMETCQLNGLPIHVECQRNRNLYHFQPQTEDKEIEETELKPWGQPANENNQEETPTTMAATASHSTPAQTTNSPKENDNGADPATANLIAKLNGAKDALRLIHSPSWQCARKICRTPLAELTDDDVWKAKELLAKLGIGKQNEEPQTEEEIPF